jgi:hypothetical protein
VTSKAHEAISVLAGFVQLTETGQLPARREVRRRTLVALSFLIIQHATAQTCGDAHHAVQLMMTDELAPLLSDINLVLRGYGVSRGAMYTILVEKQSDYLVPTRQYGLSEA